MRIEDLLREDEPAILDQAAAAIARLDHYRRDGEAATRRRLEALHRQVARAVRDRNLDDLLAHAARVARERLEAGFDLAEVNAAFAALEEAIARRAAARLPRSELAWELGIVSTAIAHARGELGRAFATAQRGPRLDLTWIFKGGYPAGDKRFTEELVYPV